MASAIAASGPVTLATFAAPKEPEPAKTQTPEPSSTDKFIDAATELLKSAHFSWSSGSWSIGFGRPLPKQKVETGK
jgi:hypothetical protein